MASRTARPARELVAAYTAAVQEALACFAPNVHLIRLPDAALAGAGDAEVITAHHLALCHGDVLPLRDDQQERLGLWFDLFFRVGERPGSLRVVGP